MRFTKICRCRWSASRCKNVIDWFSFKFIRDRKSSERFLKSSFVSCLNITIGSLSFHCIEHFSIYLIIQVGRYLLLNISSRSSYISANFVVILLYLDVNSFILFSLLFTSIKFWDCNIWYINLLLFPNSEMKRNF